jgi:hypothetical protein
MSECGRLEKARQRRIRANDRQIYLKAAIQKQKDVVRAQLRRELREQRELRELRDQRELSELRELREQRRRELVCFVIITLTANLLFWQYIITRKV